MGVTCKFAFPKSSTAARDKRRSRTFDERINDVFQTERPHGTLYMFIEVKERTKFDGLVDSLVRCITSALCLLCSLALFLTTLILALQKEVTHFGAGHQWHRTFSW